MSAFGKVLKDMKKDNDGNKIRAAAEDASVNVREQENGTITPMGSEKIEMADKKNGGGGYGHSLTVENLDGMVKSTSNKSNAMRASI